MATEDESGPAIPPYEGRKTEASTETESVKEGVRTGGATAPVTDENMKAPNPADTERGAAASPADEQPAEQTRDGDSPEEATGPAHTSGTGRGEDKA